MKSNLSSKTRIVRLVFLLTETNITYWRSWQDFEPLVIARPTELIEKLLPRFDSSCKKLTEEKTDEKESLDSECNSISHANSTKDEIANNPAITLSPDSDSISHADGMKDGVKTDSIPLIDNNMNSQNTESKF